MEIGDIIRWVDGSGSPPNFAELQSINTGDGDDDLFAEMINASGSRVSWPLALCKKAMPAEILDHGKQIGAREAESFMETNR